MVYPERMGHTAPPFVVSRDDRYFHKEDHAFTAVVVEDALVYDDPIFVGLWEAFPGVVVEYLAAAIAREDQEYAAELADLRG